MDDQHEYPGSHIRFGEMKLDYAAKRWGVTHIQAAKILLDVGYIKSAWSWVNIEDFLNDYIRKNDGKNNK